MTKTRRIIFLICTLMIAIWISSLCTCASAAIASGTCGENLSWMLEDNGVLTISGIGAMGDFYLDEDEYGNIERTNIPWYSYRETITVVSIESGATCIGMDAFSNCVNLTTINIPESISSFSIYAFYHCDRLTSINVNDENAYFSSVDGVLFNNEKTAIILYPRGREGKYIIPDDVTTVESSAFNGCKGLTEVTIGQGLACVGRSMFSGCSSLRRVRIPNNITNIEDYAFYSCANLASVSIPEGVISIGNQAFDFCRNLTNITIPYSLSSIGASAFSSRTGLMDIYYAGDEDQWSDIRISYGNDGLTKAAMHFESAGPATEIIGRGNCGEGMIWLLDDHGKLTIKGTGAMADYLLNMEQGMESTDSPWFSLRTDITSVFIEQGVTSIGEYAFLDCQNLMSVTVPRSVTSIGTGAFRNCAGLTDIYYNKSETWWNQIAIHSDNHFLTEATVHFTAIILESNHPYANKADISWTYTHPTEASYLKITFSDETETEAGCDFLYLTDEGGCTEKFTGTALADRSIWLKGKSFSIRLTSDKTVTCYGFAITGITEASEAEYNEYMDQTTASGTCGSNLTWTLSRKGILKISGTGQMRDFYWDPDEFNTSIVDTDIPWYSYRERITEVRIGKGVTSLGELAFCQCLLLTEINIPESITSIKASALYQSGGLININVNDRNAYYSSEGGVLFDKEKTAIILYPKGKVGRYIIPDSVTTIERLAFQNCPGLTEVTIGMGLTSIRDWMFSGCVNLRKVTIPDGITDIEDFAFYYCSNLRDVIIPYGVTRIGDQVFDFCSSLTSITIPHSVTSIGLAAFSEQTSVKDVFFLGAEEQWKKIAIDEDNDGLKKAAFHCWSLLKLPSELTVITREAFSNLHCQMIFVPDSCIAIEEYAFAGCSILRNVSIPARLKDEVPENAFAGCNEDLIIEWR